MNLEYLLVDSRTFVTAEDEALHTFFGAGVDSSTSYRAEIEVCALFVCGWGGEAGPSLGQGTGAGRGQRTIPAPSRLVVNPLACPPARPPCRR